MTDLELQAAIAADPTAKALADAGNDLGCAARMSSILPPTLTATFVTDRTIYAAFADWNDAAAVLAGLAAVAAGDPTADPPVPGNPAVAAAIEWLKPANGGIDLANPGVRAMLDQLGAAGVLAPASVATLKSLAEAPAKVHADDVSRAWEGTTYRQNGRVVPQDAG